jgi:hypothetical protein
MQFQMRLRKINSGTVAARRQQEVELFLRESLDHNERDAYNAAVLIRPDRLTA